MSTPNDTPNPEIPYGYCQCGCGQKTNIRSGKPNRYVMGHRIDFTPQARASAFWAKVDKSGGEDACWLWTAFCDTEGYGSFRLFNKQRGAHRVAWILANGDIPDNLSVLHNCPEGDNPRCVNPKHLWLGTHDDNMKDMARKGRGKSATGDKHGSKTHAERVLKGSQHGMSKLSERDVIHIRQRYSIGGITQHQLAEEYHLTENHVHRIIRGKLWKHIL